MGLRPRVRASRARGASLLFYAITGLVMSVEQTAWTDLSMVDPDRRGPTTNMNVSECMM